MNIRARLSPEQRAAYDAVMTTLTGPVSPCDVSGDDVRIRATLTEQQQHQARQWIALNGYRRLDIAPPAGTGNPVIEVTGAGPDGPVTEHFIATLSAKE